MSERAQLHPNETTKASRVGQVHILDCVAGVTLEGPGRLGVPCGPPLHPSAITAGKHRRWEGGREGGKERGGGDKLASVDSAAR